MPSRAPILGRRRVAPMWSFGTRHKRLAVPVLRVLRLHRVISLSRPDHLAGLHGGGQHKGSESHNFASRPQSLPTARHHWKLTPATISIAIASATTQSNSSRAPRGRSAQHFLVNVVRGDSSSRSRVWKSRYSSATMRASGGGRDLAILSLCAAEHHHRAAGSGERCGLPAPASLVRGLAWMKQRGCGPQSSTMTPSSKTSPAGRRK
jgi:hypothetical protein